MRVSKTLPLLVPITAVALCGSLQTAGAADPSPRQQLEASAKSFAAVRSYRLSITQTDKDGKSTIKADVTTAGRVDVSVTIGKTGTFRLRKVASATYLRGDAQYWKANGGNEGPTLAKKLAGRWIRVAKSDATEFSGLFAEVSPKKIAKCLVNPDATGTLTAGNSSTVGGAKANLLIDAGDKPGTAPGKLYIAADGPPLPLRVLQTGKVKPGGKNTACTDPDDTSTSSDARFSRFNEKLKIAAPKNAIKVPAGSGSSDATTA